MGVVLRHGARNGVWVCACVQQHFHPLVVIRQNKSVMDVTVSITHEHGHYATTEHPGGTDCLSYPNQHLRVPTSEPQAADCHTPYAQGTSTHPMAAASCNAVQPSAVPSVASGSARSLNSSRICTTGAERIWCYCSMTAAETTKSATYNGGVAVSRGNM